jgi:hypothetical protein
MGEYPPRLGSGALYQVVRPPDCALPPLAAWRPPDRRSGVSFGMSEALVYASGQCP